QPPVLPPKIPISNQDSNSSNFIHKNVAQTEVIPPSYHVQFEQPTGQNINQNKAQTGFIPHVHSQAHSQAHSQSHLYGRFDQPTGQNMIQNQQNQHQIINQTIQKSPDEMCQELLKKYINEYNGVINFQEPTTCNPCYHVGLGDFDGLRYHLQSGIDDVDKLYHFGGSEKYLVLIASEHCNGEAMIKIFNVLKEFGANFNVVCGDTKQTALHYLPLNSKLSEEKNCKNIKDAISFLVDNGCDINAIDKSSKRTILANYLIKRYKTKNYVSIIDLLLEKGANPNIPCGVTLPDRYFAPNALFIAIKNKWPIETLNSLLNHGANIDQLDEENNHLLIWTVMDKTDKKSKKDKESKDDIKYQSIDWVLEHSYLASEPDNLRAAEKYISKFGERRNIITRWKKATPEDRQRVKDN
ncbi:19490_t:CDS:1, partial [Racocetra fulgida]